MGSSSVGCSPHGSTRMLSMVATRTGLPAKAGVGAANVAQQLGVSLRAHVLTFRFIRLPSTILVRRLCMSDHLPTGILWCVKDLLVRNEIVQISAARNTTDMKSKHFGSRK